MTSEGENQQKSESALREERVLEFWNDKKVFLKTLSQSKGKKEFVFYEGPPTANAKPGIHHLEARAFKDAIPRYKTMRGYHVRRKGGWDTHGLPVELQVEKKLGLDSKKAIEEYGIAEFNQKCRENVWEQVDLWSNFTERIGFWIDQEHPYITYENNYIESVWNILKKTDDQGLLYKDYKVVPWCPRCGTVLSSHELAQGYEDAKDLSVYVKFKLRALSGTYFIAWTTTPWTLPGNVALAVGEKIDYVKVKVENETLILAKARLPLLGENLEIIEELKGKDLVGLEYEPLFPYLRDNLPESEKTKLEKTFKVYSADFVNTTDGTGIVHTAVMYGQDDFELGTKVGLPKFHTVDESGHFIKGTGFLEGRFVKETDENGKPTLAVDIIEDLKKRNLFFKQENYKHSYPHCWRCKTALIYYARDSWYIRMADKKIKDKLIAENKKISWEPEHIREGRFGEWLKDIKDWAISRERYWGTPLPIWVAKDGERLVVDSIDTLKKYSKKSGNKYFVIRHGGTEGNKQGVVSYKNQNQDHITEDGKKQILKSISKLKESKIDLIVTSHFVRTKETAEVVREALTLSPNAVIEDARLCEMNPGDFDGKSWEEYHSHISDTGPGWFERTITKGESLSQVKLRTAQTLYELEEKYKNKNIILVTHGAPAWLLFVNAGFYEPDGKEYHPETSSVFVKEFKKFNNAEIRPLDFVPLPHDAKFEADLHRPYIDNIVLEKNGKEFVRTKEVLDVWFDSGAMPFAQDHYPFESQPKKSWYGMVNKKEQKILYPADYICEAIDQTRGWFYTLHAIGVLMGRGRAYENVICLGHLLDAKGKKMSKSVGNVVDPWSMIEKYGADTLRLWMYAVNQPGESKNFDEKTVLLLQQQFFGLLYNVLAFYELYRDKNLEKDTKKIKSNNILDQWILTRLDELVDFTTKNLDNYKLLEPTRAIKDFIGDLSTWYLRRSRDRIKDGDAEAKRTLYFVLKTLAKVMAPFAPFSAEDIWLKLRNEKDEDSVHLTEWPKAEKINLDILAGMSFVRSFASFALKQRSEKGIKVRQQLQSFSIKHTWGEIPYWGDLKDILADEINVREVILDRSGDTDKPGLVLDTKITSELKQEGVLDTEITPELKEEGDYRAFVRAIQDMRKKMGLTPNEVISLSINTNDAGRMLIQKFEGDLKKVTSASAVKFENNDGEDVKIDELDFKVKIEK